MTVSVDAAELVTAIEVASWVATMAAMLVFGLVVYLMVRPKRRRREAEPVEEMDRAEMLRLMARMEQRLEVMERVVAARTPDEERILLTGAKGPETRRSK
jgi:heme/copper-type cytochrome/quinol oxidase subunit 2